MASADILGRCSSFIDNEKPFTIGFTPMTRWELCHRNIYVVLESERGLEWKN